MKKGTPLWCEDCRFICFETGLGKPMLALNDPNGLKNTTNVYSIHLEQRMALPCQISTGKWKYVNPCLDFLGMPDQRTAYIKRQALPRWTYVRRSSVTPDLILGSMLSVDATPGELDSRGLSGLVLFRDFFLTLRSLSPFNLFRFFCAFTLLRLVTALPLSNVFTEVPVLAAGRGALSPDDDSTGHTSVAVGGAPCSGAGCTRSSVGGDTGGRPREGAGSRHWSVSQRGSLVGAAHLYWQVISLVFHTLRLKVYHTSVNKGTRDCLSLIFVTPFPKTIHNV